MKNLIIIALSILIASCASKKPIDNHSQFYMSGFDGIWTGETTSTKEQNFPFGPNEKNNLPLKLVINEGEVSVYIKGSNNTYKEVKSGKFNITSHKTNAIIYAQDSEFDTYGANDNSGWAETWNITITHKDNSSLYVYLVRCVHNIDIPYNEGSEEYPARFFRSFIGELKKSSLEEKINPHAI